MSKALIVYGTRYGAAASTAQEIAKTLAQAGLDVKVLNAKEEKVQSIADYSLVVVGSGIQINRWTSEPEDFLKKFKKELATKKLALFVCCGSATADQQAVANAKDKYLQQKAAKYHLQPVALGLFGGVYNYNNVPWWAKKALEADKQRIQATYKETSPGIYDSRDLTAIQEWARQLATS
jgi:menaquinone-dependent protoporphyrinogen oxidase